MAVFISYNISDVEWKTLLKAIEWAKTQFDFSEAEVCRQALAEFRVCVRNQWAERLRTLESSLKAASKTATAAYYVKCIALRELQLTQVQLRQQLASSAPIERLILRGRPPSRCFPMFCLRSCHDTDCKVP